MIEKKERDPSKRREKREKIVLIMRKSHALSTLVHIVIDFFNRAYISMLHDYI